MHGCCSLCICFPDRMKTSRGPHPDRELYGLPALDLNQIDVTQLLAFAAVKPSALPKYFKGRRPTGSTTYFNGYHPTKNIKMQCLLRCPTRDPK